MKIIGRIFLLSIAVHVGSLGNQEWNEASGERLNQREDTMTNYTGTATGVIKIDDKALDLKHAYAMSQPNTFEKEKNDIAVLLTATPLQDGALNGKNSLEEAVVGLSRFALVIIDDEGNAIAETIDHPSLEGRRLAVSGKTQSEVILKNLDKDRIEGSFVTKKPVRWFKFMYDINVSFEAPIVQAKSSDPLPDMKTGQGLPADGGEPGKQFLAFVAAIHNKDLKTVRGMIPPGQPSFENEDDLEMIAMMTPANPKIEKGIVKDDRVVLYVSGTLEDEKTWGTIEMFKKDGRWWIGKMGWSNKPPEE